MSIEYGNGTRQFDFPLPATQDADQPTINSLLGRIRRESRSEAEKGRWFENLVAKSLTTVWDLKCVYEIEDVWRWSEWPDREYVTGLDGADIGIDLVARRTRGEWVAIQCKCYDENYRVGVRDVTHFRGLASDPYWKMGLFVATCDWTREAEKLLRGPSNQLRRIDLLNYGSRKLPLEADVERPVRGFRPLQEDAFKNVVDGLAVHDRGRLIMPCGTGKTFVSLRIAENIVSENGTILFLAPSIALVAQARREWLLNAVRRLHCLVVCSDRTAGRAGNEDIGLSELECPVSTDPKEIADHLSSPKNGGGRKPYSAPISPLTR